jgi:shikimate dehydrogenase
LKKYGLIGYPLGHSFSKDFFEKKFFREGIINSQYDLYPIEDVNDFKKILAENENIRGLNVTIPHKVNIIPLLDELHDTAKQVGAVNTIKIINGKTIGYNTDTWGFAKSLFPEITAFKSNALILGNGGASKAVQYVFNKLNISYKIVSRNKEASDYLYSELNKEIIDEVGIIVQTTLVGMYPNIHDTVEFPFEALSANHYCLDLVYNPEETLFLKKSKAAGAITKNGMQMLIEQAEESWRIWL